VHNIFAIIDAEGNKAASEAETKEEETNAEQPAKTTSLIDGCCCDGGVARWAHAHNRRSAKTDRLNGHHCGNRLGSGNGCRLCIGNRLGRCGVGNGSRLTRGHFCSVGVHGRLTRLTVGCSVVVHIRGRSHFCLG